MESISYFNTLNPVIGWLRVMVRDNILVDIDFLSPAENAALPLSAPTEPVNAIETKVHQALQAYFNRQAVDFSDLPLDLSAHTPFQRDVWRVVSEIPAGETQTYQWVGDRINRPKAARAVGQALRANPVPIVIPCHRVVARDSSLCGFMGGAEHGLRIKTALLELEGARSPERLLSLAQRAV